MITKWLGVQVPVVCILVCVHMTCADPVGQVFDGWKTVLSDWYGRSFLPFTGGYTEWILIPKASAAAFIVHAEEYAESLAQSMHASSYDGERLYISAEFLIVV